MTANKILIVEDEAPIREMIAFHLARAGFETLEAPDCRAARELLVDERPDLALIDWMLPNMSGLELTRMLKRDKENDDLAVIMLTARADEYDKVAGLDSGADDYITKPFSPRELVARIQAVLRRVKAGGDGETVRLGALIATFLALVWQVRQLLAFDRALHTGNFDTFRFGDGIWQQIFSRFSYEHERGGRYKQEHRRLLKEIRKSTNAMPDGAVIIDDANEIIFCNRTAKGLAGLKRKKDRGQRIDNILRDPDLTELLQAGDSTQTIDIASPVKDEAWLNCRVVPYGANQKLLLLRDVTGRMALNKMRRDFVANASHELRSPLTVISGYLDALGQDRDIPSTWAQPISRMQDQARRMTRIVRELLELSRLEGSGSASTEDIVDVPGLLAVARKAYQGQAGVPSMDVEIDSDAQLLGNTGEIESVISNLLSNAIRHTLADGAITLAWRMGADGAELVVSDSGEGIEEEYIPRLTERFFRVDRGRAREDGGIGLGLAIVKHVLGRHEAELQISSEPGAGSEFRCVFPAARIVESH